MSRHQDNRDTACTTRRCDGDNEPTAATTLAQHATRRFTTKTIRWNPTTTRAERTDFGYYTSCALGGVLASSNRWLLTPLDVIKVNMQANPAQHSSIRTSFRLLAKQGGLYKGLGATAVAYGLQTGTKYSCYEVFKDTSSKWLGPDMARKHRGLVFAVSAGCAETLATILMCPWEMLKVQVQTSSSSSAGRVAATSFPTKFGPALRTMLAHRNDFKFPFGSLAPLLCRQVPFTIANFYTFENTVSFLRLHLLLTDATATSQLAVSFAAGYIAGFVSSVVSHPADSLVSLLSQPRYQGQSVSSIVRQVGLWRLATRGLLPRTLLTGTVIACQWWIYDAFKVAMGMETTGGVSSRLTKSYEL